MAESPAKKQCVTTEEKKLEDPGQRLEQEVIYERIYATRKLIKINTEPPTYINTLLVITSKSRVLDSMTHTSIKDSTFETNEFGDRCLLCLPHENIPRQTWVLLDMLFNNGYTLDSADIINNTTLDDLLYICFKYEIKIGLIADIKCPTNGSWTKLQLVIMSINARKIKQYFPRTQDIPEVNQYYSTLGSVYADAATRFGTLEDKMSFLSSFDLIPPIHHATMTIIATRALQGIRI